MFHLSKLNLLANLEEPIGGAARFALSPDAAEHGTSGNDHLTGTANDDVFYLGGGGDDTANGKGGNDTFKMGGALTAADRINGGSGTDVVELNGDYTFSTILAPTVLTSVEKIVLTGGGNYNLTVDGRDTSTNRLYIDASAIDHSHHVWLSTWPGAGFTIIGGHGPDEMGGSHGNDVIKGGAGADVLGGNSDDEVTANHNGADKLYGQGGNDTFNLAGDFTADDHVDGGSGKDTAFFFANHTGANAIVLNDDTIVNVEIFRLGSGEDYSITTADGTVAAGKTLTLNGTALDSAHTVRFNGSAEHDGAFILHGGAGNDALTGGAKNDMLRGGGGADTLNGRGGNDQFVYIQVSDSTSTGFDKVIGFDADRDTFNMPASVSHIDSEVTSGQLNAATFDTDLANALNGHFFGGDAVLFKPSSGDYANHVFLVIDANAMDGYQASADYVIQLASAKHLDHLATGDFI